MSCTMTLTPTIIPEEMKFGHMFCMQVATRGSSQTLANPWANKLQNKIPKIMPRISQKNVGREYWRVMFRIF
jgi:hypothetical protein